jgi:hypothetical protein
MNFRKANNVTGWAVFLIALITYVMTREARGSLWDTGEFIASAQKLQLPHPPGAPVFTLIGRFFIILFGDNAMTAASAVNFMSALASAATILFLFWTITHFARKMFVGVGEELSVSPFSPRWQPVSSVLLLIHSAIHFGLAQWKVKFMLCHRSSQHWFFGRC